MNQTLFITFTIFLVLTACTAPTSALTPTPQPSPQPTTLTETHDPKLTPIPSPTLSTLPTAEPAQPLPAGAYDPGEYVISDIWVDPINGDDTRAGFPQDQAVRTLAEAWNRIPQGTPLNGTGYRINLFPGTYTPEYTPNYWESRYGSAQFPIIIQPASGNGTVTLPSVNIYDVRYLYIFGINFQSENDVFHCERCDHILLRDVTITGAPSGSTQEAVKFNQSQNIFIENSTISGGWDNAVDWVAVQYGHVLNSEIFGSGDWCMYAKGGSAYLRVEGNEFHSCGTGGFTAGQGTGFQFMVAPWLQYEAYDVKVVNNIFHDLEGAAFGVNGGYNILIAYNTAYRVGARSHVIEVAFGGRSCDGQPGDEGRERCDEYAAQGGWGNNLVPDGNNYVRIPNRNVFIYNNLIFNPDGYQSQWQHFFIPGPAPASGGVPAPVTADNNLVIKGNVIWNGPAGHPLGVDDTTGCAAENPTCNPTQILSENAINTVKPQLRAPDSGDYHLLNRLTVTPAVIPPFVWEIGTVPQGNLDNSVPTDRDGHPRTGSDNAPGAYLERWLVWLSLLFG